MTETTITRSRSVRDRRPRATSEYAELLATVQGLGLLRRRYFYYAVKAAVLAGALGAAVTGVVLLGDHWAQLGMAAGLAVVLTQIIFLSHDAAHRQIFRSHRANEIAALIMGTAIAGVSLAWWNAKHTRHHAAPNQIGKDTDIAPSIVHFYPAVQPPRSRLGRLLHERQGWWFFPLLVVEMLNLHVQSAQALLTRRDLKRRRTELAIMAVRLVGYPILLVWLLPLGMAAAFLAVQLAVTGLYLGTSFAASHIGMPVLPAEARLDFLRRQVLMSRNISGGRVASLAMGGLNYQIEHHLFPSMPRPTLRRVRPVVLDHCRHHQISYQQVTILRAWRIVAAHLNRVGRSARDPFRCPVSAALR